MRHKGTADFELWPTACTRAGYSAAVGISQKVKNEKSTIVILFRVWRCQTTIGVDYDLIVY